MSDRADYIRVGIGSIGTAFGFALDNAGSIAGLMTGAYMFVCILEKFGFLPKRKKNDK